VCRTRKCYGGLRCGGRAIVGDELAAAVEQLDQLDALKQQLMLTQASLEEIPCHRLPRKEWARALVARVHSWKDHPTGRGPAPEVGVGYGPPERRVTIHRHRAPPEKQSRDRSCHCQLVFQESQIKGEAEA
jgi:hypothetical protein